MTDYFKDNPDLFMTGSFQEIATKIEKEWWEDKRKRLNQLSGSLDVELLELLPSDLRNNLIQSPEIFDEENPPDDSFLFQTFKRDKGEGYIVCCNNKLFNDTKKVPKKEKEEIIEILQNQLSYEEIVYEPRFR